MKYDRKKSLFFRKAPASFTVEASVIIPIILFIVIFGIRVALEQYGEVKEQAQCSVSINEIDPVDIMWNIEKIREGLKGIGNED